MALFPYHRLAQLFEIIRGEILPQTELAKRLSVSSRTVRADVSVLNSILISYGAQIYYERSFGYQLAISDEHLFSKLLIKQQKKNHLPRTNHERVQTLISYFLTQNEFIKLDDLAERWFISRSSIQNALSEVRDFFHRYHLSLEIKPYYGMHLVGEETNIRLCLTDLFWQTHSENSFFSFHQLKHEMLKNIDLKYFEKLLCTNFKRFDIKLTVEGLRYLLYYCAVSISRITNGKEFVHVSKNENEIDPIIFKAANEIARGFVHFLGFELSQAEYHHLILQIAARCIIDSSIVQDEMNEKSQQFIQQILQYINDHYNYDLRSDLQLKNDLSIHITSMLLRLRYQVRSTNPLLDEIKRYYPFAYDITLSALTKTQEYKKYKLSEDEIGYLAIHIGVGLERSYGVTFQRHPQVLLVSDSTNATIRMVESKIMQHFPLIKIVQVLSLQEYENLTEIQEDFVITTIQISEKNRPIVKLAAFPTNYQLEQLGHLAMIDRTNPYILENFFDENLFMIIDEIISQEELFKIAHQKLYESHYVDSDFYFSLIERESIVSTMLGEGIAIPHSLGLVAKKTVVLTILSSNGIIWNNDKSEIAHVIFVLAISKDEYEKAMGIYDLFVNFVKEKATKRLLNSQSFSDFKAIAKDSISRISQ